MAILTLSGREAIAIALRAQVLHLAWGTGDPAWDAAPAAETIAIRALTAEVGRRAVDEAAFCVADAAGDIVVPSGRFLRSAAPTNNLYVRAAFDFGDAPNSVIREVALHLGTVVKPELPPGQRYFTPAEIDDFGTLLAVERIVRIDRTPARRQFFDFVATI